jgi:hypothetical protein
MIGFGLDLTEVQDVTLGLDKNRPIFGYCGWYLWGIGVVDIGADT